MAQKLWLTRNSLFKFQIISELTEIAAETSGGLSAEEYEKMRELNQKMTTGMQQMQQALISTRKEKNEIIAKSEQGKVWYSFCVIGYDS